MVRRSGTRFWILPAPTIQNLSWKRQYTLNLSILLRVASFFAIFYRRDFHYTNVHDGNNHNTRRRCWWSCRNHLQTSFQCASHRLWNSPCALYSRCGSDPTIGWIHCCSVCALQSYYFFREECNSLSAFFAEDLANWRHNRSLFDINAFILFL